MDTATTHRPVSDSAKTVWRLVTGLISMSVGLWLMADAGDYLMPGLTGLAMLWAGMFSAGSTFVGRLSFAPAGMKTQASR